MATAWKVAAATAVLGWLVAPIITLILPKILSRLGFDASKKLRELEFNIIPELKKTLHVVDQERMLGRGLKDSDDVAVLDKMAAMLRRAREEAEELVDDHQEIELYRNTCSQCLYGVMKACPGIILGGWARLLQWMRRNSSLQRLYGAVNTCIIVVYGSVKACVARCLGIAGIIQSGSARLLQWVRNWFKEAVHVNTTTTTSDDHVGVTIHAGVSLEEAVSEDTTSDSATVPVTVAPSCSSSDIFKSCCSSIFYWIVHGFAAARFYRDWSYEVVDLTSNKNNATALDFLLTAISRWDLKRRIEKLENTICDVKKSPLSGVARKIAPEDIADKNRSKIRTPSNRKVFGREALRDSIMAKLREKPHGTGPCYSVIGIYGVAGSGKTTFARYIRDFIEGECKEEKLFHTVMCIHVSETFSVDDIFHEMLNDITKDRHSNILDRQELEEKLKESLCGKRFCLILDDLWVKTKNDPQLEELISPFNVGLKGSKILVTARTKVSARALCAVEPTEMPDLDAEQYLSMFMHYALGSTSVTSDEFERVGRLIAEKLHGSPIAAVIVAGQLGANRDIRFWKNMAERDMFNDTMDTLWWSYQQLSSEIKRCFEYCNIFPRRIKLKRGDLVHLWIAQGFVTSCTRDDMEHVAEGYIQELASCSFLQQEKTWNGEECFRIHDLIHDLADMVTGTDCIKLENESGQRGGSWKGDIPQDVRHIFIQNYDAKLITEKILGLGNLRTLIINVVGRDTQVEEKVIDSICKKLMKLRVLAIAFSQEHDPIEQPEEFSFPESVGQLEYLRYLAFRANICKINLPSTINRLHHIQLLDFGNGIIAEFTFDELVNLRHIFCWQYVKLPYVGKLSSLQTLPGFEVSNEQGCELKQLRELNKLQGKLRINGLENVKSKAQALQANLTAKERLTELSLWWNIDDEPRCSREVEADVLEGLCPPVGLKILELLNFSGCRYPDWMLGKHSSGPKYLQELHFLRYRQSGPASGLVEAFPHLCVLKLWVCSWDTLPGDMEKLTSLKKLYIILCQNIRSLPSLPQSLEKFQLWCCNAEFTESCKTVGHPNWEKIEHIPKKDIM